MIIRPILAVAILATGIAVMGCSDAASAPAASSKVISGPSLTIGSGFTATPLVRANAGAFHVQSKYPGFDIELKTHDNADIEIVSQLGVAGAHSGWHSHPGPVLVAVKSGTLVVYQGDDLTCTPQVYPAGTTFIEGIRSHIVRNETATGAEFVAVFFVPAGAPRRIDQPNPGNCPF